MKVERRQGGDGDNEIGIKVVTYGLSAWYEPLLMLWLSSG